MVEAHDKMYFLSGLAYVWNGMYSEECMCNMCVKDTAAMKFQMYFKRVFAHILLSKFLPEKKTETENGPRFDRDKNHVAQIYFCKTFFLKVATDTSHLKHFPKIHHFF